MDVYPMSKCFATVVNKTRRPHWIWAGLPVVLPVVLLLVMVAEGSGCSPLLTAAGSMHLVVGLVNLWFLPHRQLSSNVLQSLGILTNGVLLIASAALSRTPDSDGLMSLCRGLSMLQTAISTVRTTNTVVCWVINKLFRVTWLMRVNPYKDPHGQCLGGGWCGNGWAHDDLTSQDINMLIEEPTFVFEFRSVGWCADTVKKTVLEDGGDDALDVPMTSSFVYKGISDEERARVAHYIQNMDTIEALRSQGLLPPSPPPKRWRRKKNGKVGFA
eukprot:TRINITY_DN18549_c0_g1_i3.p2 TRINITY_DN18549_c0_g1~~TRINITY_DN18549_c0_g1_i3.p2  ORF type:complete len:272 (-),score=68.55 TRINITY_DN18549_c0_g1_i3:99-914(-)